MDIRETYKKIRNSVSLVEFTTNNEIIEFASNVCLIYIRL